MNKPAQYGISTAISDVENRRRRPDGNDYNDDGCCMEFGKKTRKLPKESVGYSEECGDTPAILDRESAS